MVRIRKNGVVVAGTSLFLLVLTSVPRRKTRLFGGFGHKTVVSNVNIKELYTHTHTHCHGMS